MRILGVVLAILLGFQPLSAPAAASPDSSDEKAIRELEEKITEAKEGVFRSKARLQELEAAVLRGKIAGTKALITFDNRAEGFFALSSAEFYLDGKLIQKINMEGRKQAVEEMKIFDGDVPAGQHTLEATILYRGSDKSIYTMFSYFKDHKFELRTKEKFDVDYGKTADVKLTAMDRGYFKTDLKERLFLNVKTSKDWAAEPPPQ